MQDKNVLLAHEFAEFLTQKNKELLPIFAPLFLAFQTTENSKPPCCSCSSVSHGALARALAHSEYRGAKYLWVTFCAFLFNFAPPLKTSPPPKKTKKNQNKRKKQKICEYNHCISANYGALPGNSEQRGAKKLYVTCVPAFLAFF